MSCYNLIDIALDTTPWSSATTGFDALGMGVPLVAIRGSKPSARMGSSLVKGIGHQEWIAETPEEFATVVKALGLDYLKHRQNKTDFQKRVLGGPLYDGHSLTFCLQEAFCAMAQRASIKKGHLA
jgi:predicted O-linked N-acetylglucosamine transferase (SPINDLY family)